jgi:hypothetical protein
MQNGTGLRSQIGTPALKPSLKTRALFWDNALTGPEQALIIQISSNFVSRCLMFG